MLVYLSGSIEFADDGGKAWRRELAPFLRQTLGHQVYDPAGDEKKNLTKEEVAHFRAWKTADPDRFRQTVRKIINWDLDKIEQRADYVICYWDSSSAGTAAELTAAYRRGIPVYLVTELPVDEISGWVLGCAERVFGSFEELKAFLVQEYGSASER
jgi:nucleoside 2-deoxyribosyltransferase